MSEEKIFVTKTSLPPFEEYAGMIEKLWESHWITNMGTYHNTLEKELAEYLDVSQLSLVVNGHTALEIAIQSFGFPKGSEIITTPFTFISTTHSIVRSGYTPVFCDVKEADGTMDESLIESLITDRTVAILPVHVYGNVCNVDAIGEIAKKHGLKVIYDAAHTFGEKYKGRGVGSYGELSVFSFHATKVYNTIEGGAIAGGSADDHKRFSFMRDFGIEDEESITEVGPNGKMNEFCAAMGLCNLRHVDDAIASRAECAAEYRRHLEGLSHIRILKEEKDLIPNHGYFPVVFESEKARDEAYEKLKEQGINTRKYFYPTTPDAACYKDRFPEARIDTARDLASRVLTLPIYEGLSTEDVARTAEALK